MTSRGFCFGRRVRHTPARPRIPPRNPPNTPDCRASLWGFEVVYGSFSASPSAASLKSESSGFQGRFRGTQRLSLGLRLLHLVVALQLSTTCSELVSNYMSEIGLTRRRTHCKNNQKQAPTTTTLYPTLLPPLTTTTISYSISLFWQLSIRNLKEASCRAKGI